MSGRFVQPGGKPVAGVRVYLQAGRARDLPGRQTLSGTDGAFHFTDVSTSAAAGLHWYPPEQWLEGGMAIAGESLENIDVGEIKLDPNTVLRVVVEPVGGPPLLEREREPSVVLEGDGRGPRIVAERSGRFMTLSQIPFREGHWEVTVLAKGRTEHFSAPARLTPGRRDQMFLLRLLRDTVQKGRLHSHEGQMEVLETLIPESFLEREFRASGRLVAPDGAPIEGALASVSDVMFAKTAPAWTFSDALGHFDLRYTGATCREPGFAFGRSEPWVLKRDAKPESCDQKWAGERDVVIPSATKLVLKPVGIDPSRVRAYWWHSSFGWRPFATLEPWVSLASYKNNFLVAMYADGYAPVVKELDLPEVNTDKGQVPPERFDAEFPFTDTAARELIVLSNNRPVSGATVDLEWIRDLRAGRRLLLGSFQTGTDGKLRLTGASGQLMEALIYARGMEPGRAIWEPGELLRVDLPAREARLAFPGMRPGYVARVRRADQPEAVRTVRSGYNGPEDLPVVPGAYDITMIGDTGQPRGYQRIVVGRGEIRRVAPDTDQRPAIVVRYPEEGWTAEVTDSTPSGMAFGWTIYSTVGGQFSVRDVAAVLERESLRESVFRLSHAGRFHVQARQESVEQSWWREVEVAPGATVTLDVPKRSATLHGSMRTYDGGIGYSHHGWAGPRFELIADDPDAWSVTVFIPPRDGKETFTLRGLPAGSYHLYQHLIGTRKTYKDNEGKEHSYTSAVDAWGGIPVSLTPGEDATLKDFADYAYQDLSVKVEDAGGAPVSRATLRVRDRMSEAWRQVAEGPTTLSYASDPIPYPPAVRIEQGHAKLPSIRAGRLELFLELDNGRVYPLSADVDPAAVLDLKLPLAGGRP